MKLSIASLLIVGATASSSSIRANSKTGQKMLSSARRLDGGDDNMSWAANYSLRFEKCATTNDYYGGYFGGNQNNENNNNQANYNGLYQQRLVHFKLCPSDSCSSGCSGGGDYVMDMNEFVMAYMEYKQEAQEAQCESVANSCYCEDANDDEACQTQCWSNAGIYELCVDQDEQNNNNGNNDGQQEEEFAVEDALECVQLEIDEEAAQYYNYNQNGNNNQNYNYNNGQNNNNNQNGQQDVEFFVGPYCSANGKNILLGVFMDETCSYSAPDGVYEKYHYGKSLPYSSESIISNDCISCMQPAEEDENENQNNNNNNQNYNNNNGDYNYNYNQEEQEEAEVLEFCTNLYQDAGKCESNMNIYNHWPNTMACEFIQGLNPWGKTRIFSSFAEAKKNVTPGVLAGVFAVTTAAFGGVSYFFHKKLQRQSVGLVHGQGGSLA